MEETGRWSKGPHVFTESPCARSCLLQRLCQQLLSLGFCCVSQFAFQGSLPCQHLNAPICSLSSKNLLLPSATVVYSRGLFALGHPPSLSHSLHPASLLPSFPSFPFHLVMFHSDGSTSKHVFNLPCLIGRPTLESPLLNQIILVPVITPRAANICHILCHQISLTAFVTYFWMSSYFKTLSLLF